MRSTARVVSPCGAATLVWLCAGNVCGGAELMPGMGPIDADVGGGVEDDAAMVLDALPVGVGVEDDACSTVIVAVIEEWIEQW
jgi:hypothetical protein